MFTLVNAALAWLAINYIPFIIFYVIGGGLYATLKWVIELMRLGREVKKLDIRGLTDDKIKEKRARIASGMFTSYEYPPQASSNKGKLFMWATFWPINLVHTLFADVIRESWNFLYNKFGAVLDFIAKKILP